MGRSGSTCAVAICSSPRNVMYHRFPHANGIGQRLRGIEIENQAKYHLALFILPFIDFKSLQERCFLN